MSVAARTFESLTPPPPPGPRILVVDDNEPTARALSSLLAAARYQTAIAHRGADALDRARAQRFAAAIVDIHLPDMSGLDVAVHLREILGDEAPIIMMSGDTSMQTISALSHVGATYFFGKPLNSGPFLEQLGQWVQRPGMTAV